MGHVAYIRDGMNEYRLQPENIKYVEDWIFIDFGD
jgi:hypothetical protein